MKPALIALGAIAALVLLFIFLPVAAWILVGLVLLLLALVLFLPIGADVSYIGGAFKLSARANGFAMQLIPRRPRPEKPPRPKKEKPPKEKPKEEQAAKPKKKLSLNLSSDELLELAKRAIRGLGKFGRLTVRKFMLHFVAAGDDPYNTAMFLGWVNMALSTLAPICREKFRVTGDVDVQTDADFAAESIVLDAELSVTLRLAQVVHAGLAVAFGALGVLIQNKRRLRRERREAKKSGTAETAEARPETAAETAPESAPSGTPEQQSEQKEEFQITEPKQAEERKDSHG